VSDFDLRAKGASAINDTVCRWQEVTNEGGLAPPECTRPARWVSCVPFMQTPTCDEHKCRCAKPIEATNETGAVDESDAIDALSLSPDVTRILKQIRSEALTAAEQHGAAKERAAVVAWLERMWNCGYSDAYFLKQEIERGDHVKEGDNDE